MDLFDFMSKGFVVAWVLSILVALGFTVVVAWGIIELVLHFTG